jgi:hypothetical protein
MRSSSLPTDLIKSESIPADIVLGGSVFDFGILNTSHFVNNKSNCAPLPYWTRRQVLLGNYLEAKL